MEENIVLYSVTYENIGNTLIRGNDVKYIYARGNFQKLRRFIPFHRGIFSFLGRFKEGRTKNNTSHERKYFSSFSHL